MILLDIGTNDASRRPGEVNPFHLTSERAWLSKFGGPRGKYRWRWKSGWEKNKSFRATKSRKTGPTGHPLNRCIVRDLNSCRRRQGAQGWTTLAWYLIFVRDTSYRIVRNNIQGGGVNVNTNWMKSKNFILTAIFPTLFVRTYFGIKKYIVSTILIKKPRIRHFDYCIGFKVF